MTPARALRVCWVLRWRATDWYFASWNHKPWYQAKKHAWRFRTLEDARSFRADFWGYESDPFGSGAISIRRLTRKASTEPTPKGEGR